MDQRGEYYEQLLRGTYLRMRKKLGFPFIKGVLALSLLAGLIPLLPSGTAHAQSSCGAGCLKFDIVVIGSEIQGVTLARSAKDLGLDVLILDPRSKPGGELIQGQMQVLDEPNDNKGRSLVQGSIKALYDEYKAGSIRSSEEFKQYYDRTIRGIPMRSGITIEDVKTKESNGEHVLESVIYKARDGLKYEVQAEYFVENTDFNALTRNLNVERIPGMESLYNRTDPDYMAATYMLKFKGIQWGKLHQAILKDYPLTQVRKKYGQNTYVDWDFATGFSNITLKYKPQDDQLRLRGLNITYTGKGQVLVNALLIYDVDPSDAESIRSAVNKGKKEAPHVLKYLRKNIAGFEKAELNGFPEYLYIRDYNRYSTKYVLHESDLMNGRMFWDNVTIGGYALDLQGTKTMPLGMGYGKPDRYGIPLRSYLLDSYNNVIVVGKNIGATIKAYGSARIMPTTTLAAQTIGIILGREWNSGKRLDELTATDFKRIHQYLKQDYHISIRK